MRIVITRDLAGYGWHAYDENYGGPPEHCGHGLTQHDAITDLLMWLDPEPDEAITVLEDA